MFTQEEIAFTNELFARQQVSIMQPTAEDVSKLAKGIIAKMTELKEQYESSKSKGGTTNDTVKHNAPLGRRKNNAT